MKASPGFDVRLTDDTQDMLLITAKGRGIRFHESEVRAMGRSAVGVKGIELEEDDRVIGRRACTSGGRSAHDYRKRFRQAHTG